MCVEWFLTCDLLLYRCNQENVGRASCFFLIFTLLQGWFSWCLPFVDACSPALYCLESKAVHFLFSQAVLFEASASHLRECFVEKLARSILKNEPQNQGYAFAKRAQMLSVCDTCSNWERSVCLEVSWLWILVWSLVESLVVIRKRLALWHGVVVRGGWRLFLEPERSPDHPCWKL